MYQNGKIPLMLAVNNGHVPMVEYLVEKGADIEAKDGVSDAIIDVLTRMHILFVTQCFSVDILY